MNFKLVKWDSNINNLVFLALGILLLVFPELSMNTASYLIASVLLIAGANYLIKMYKNKASITNGDILYLIISLAAIVLSISIFVSPLWIINLINILLGVILIISSLINLKNLFSFKKNRTKSWWFYFIILSLILIAGVTIVIKPISLAKIIVQIAGVALIINSISTYFLSKKINKYLLIENKSSDN